MGAPGSPPHLDLLILGGGVSGLWLLARCRAAGYRVALVETRTLGGGQTLASQGIIHGGTKYALGGHLSGAARAIAAMPGRWRACLEGRGELDLSRVGVLSEHQYLWTAGGLKAELAGFFASHAMRGRVTALGGAARPAPFQGCEGPLYRLDEPVLEVRSLVAELARHGGFCLGAERLEIQAGEAPRVVLEGTGERLTLRPRRLVLAAGPGNEALLQSLGRAGPVMQRRPLHMLMVRGELPPLYAHCLGAGSRPRLTVTSHPLETGGWVWYLGGDLAETGVARAPAEQASLAREELKALLPWLEPDLKHLEWASLRLDRAEPRQPGGRRPDGPFLDTRDGVSVAWPTKLAFAPLLASALLADLTAAGLTPGGGDEDWEAALAAWPRAPLGGLPWETATWS